MYGHKKRIPYDGYPSFVGRAKSSCELQRRSDKLPHQSNTSNTDSDANLMYYNTKIPQLYGGCKLLVEIINQGAAHPPPVSYLLPSNPQQVELRHTLRVNLHRPPVMSHTLRVHMHVCRPSKCICSGCSCLQMTQLVGYRLLIL